TSAQNLKKWCNGCHSMKILNEFWHLSRNGSHREHDTCNQCYLKNKGKKKSTSKLNQSENLKSYEITQTDSSIYEGSENLDFGLESSINELQYENKGDECDNQDDNSLKVLRYDLDEMQEVTAKIFKEAEAQNESIKFIYEIEIDQDILSTVSLTKLDLDSNNLKTIENRFLQLAYAFIVPLKLGSGYYWEKKIDSQPSKRVSEAHAPIERYACLGNIKLTIIPEEQYILVQGHHNVTYTKPTYWQIEFPIEARKWIQNNLYLEQPKFIEKGFKVLTYLENDFVRVLGFLTPLFKHVDIKNATEIVIDSTFKTNKERFELFVINLNCGG
ncbi:13433_t:CDS:2, partial [Cetraspora pellucida]